MRKGFLWDGADPRSTIAVPQTATGEPILTELFPDEARPEETVPSATVNIDPVRKAAVDWSEIPVPQS